MKTFFSFVLAFLFTAFSHVTAQPTDWVPTGMGGGGAFFATSISPHNPQEAFIACDMTDYFHTTNFGRKWDVIPFANIETNNRTGLAQFTSDPNIIFTLDGSEINGSSTTRPTKSTDAGKTWHVLANDPTQGGAFHLFADPASTSRIILADYKNVFFSNDAGISWAKIYSDPTNSYIAGVFWDGANIVVALSNSLLSSSDNAATFSVSANSGIPSTEQIVSFAAAKSNGVSRFFCVTLAAGNVYSGITGADFNAFKGVYSLDYAPNSSWQKKMSGINGINKPFFVAMAQNNTAVAYLAGGNGTSPIVFKTSDAGNSWANVFLTTNNQNISTGWSGDSGDRLWSYGEYALGFAAAPNNPNFLIISDLGFAHGSSDGGVSWTSLYVDPASKNPAAAPTPKYHSYKSVGLENTTCWQVFWTDSSNIWGAFSDMKGIRSTDAGLSWSQDYTGHADNSLYSVVKSSVNGAEFIYGATASVHDIFQSTRLTDVTLDAGSGKVLSSSDKGKSWLTLHDFKHPVVWLAIDPNNPKKMFASVVHSTLGGIFVSSDIEKGTLSSWSKLANPPRTEGHPFNIRVLADGAIVASFSARRTTNFTQSAGVFYSTNSGASWLDRSDDGLKYWTQDVVIDPNDANQNTWLAGAYSGWGGAANNKGGLYKTTNRGVSWTRIWTAEGVTSVSFNPEKLSEMYVATETQGLWFSDNANSASPQFSPVLTYPFRQPERIFFNPYRKGQIWITSFGNGIRIGGDSTPIIPLATPSQRLPKDNSANLTLPITFLWDSIPTSKAFYKLQIASNPQFTQNLQELTGAETTALLPSFVFGQTYYWRIQAFQGSTSSNWSPTWSFTVETLINVHDNASIPFPIDIFPNPTDNNLILHCDMPASDIGCYVLTNLLGEVILQSDIALNAGRNEITINTISLNRGVYLLKLSLGKVDFIRKVIIGK